MTLGIIHLPWWGYILVALVLTHITIVSVTIYLHRHQAHRALDLHPVVSHFFRFWLWFATGTITKEWTAIHRKHHAKVESDDDPHSPQILGIDKVLWEGAELYREESFNAETLEQYGHGTPDDWLERKIYSPHSYKGIALLFFVDIVIFGPIGISIWAIQMIWIPFFAAGVINGVGHFWGYRNYESSDASTNIVPWGILIGGEELHNNHHAFASSAKLSSKWWEFDIGWMYIRLLEMAGLAKVKKLAPKPRLEPSKVAIDADTVRAVVANRLHVMSKYGQDVVAQVYSEELGKADAGVKALLKPLKSLMTREESLITDDAKRYLERLLECNQPLELVYEFKQRLQQIWNEKSASQEALLKSLQEWCRQAEQTGIKALQDFAASLQGYTLQPVRA